MTRITIDPAFANQLNQVTNVAELCDSSGRVLGRFIPLVDMSEWEPISPNVSEEELDRREQSTKWYSTDEVLAHLKNLEKP